MILQHVPSTFSRINGRDELSRELHALDPLNRSTDVDVVIDPPSSSIILKKLRCAPTQYEWTNAWFFYDAVITLVIELKFLH
jgi:hypothetical protein